jgi:UDP-glucose 4-epimerase
MDHDDGRINPSVFNTHSTVGELAMKVIVTGGAGFIGANLCRMLSIEPAVETVVVIDDLSTGCRENLEGLDRIELVVGSILDRDLLADQLDGADAVVHLAARPSVPRSLADPMATHAVNATGTMNVLEAARTSGGDPQVIVASSSSVYGANTALPKREDMATLPVSPYAASKLATEAYALSYRRSFNLPVVAFRFFNVFGPLQPADHAYAAVVPSFVSRALADEPLQIHGDGLQTRDFTYVGNVAEVLAECVRRRISNAEPINLAFGSRVSLLAVVELLEKILGVEIPRQHVAPRPGDVRDSQADQTAFRQLFSDVEVVNLEEGLRATVDWFRTSQLTP